MNRQSLLLGMVVTALFSLGGCRDPSEGVRGDADASPAATRFLLAEEPPKARNVLEVESELENREQPEQWAEVVLLARIGGGDGPTWDPDRAAFTVTDLSLSLEGAQTHESPQHDADSCPFCRAKKQKRLAATAIVELMDEDGVPPVDARKLLGLAEGQTVVLLGVARIDGLGGLAVRCRGVYLRIR